jgi:two-component system NarL family sensor kinase
VTEDQRGFHDANARTVAAVEAALAGGEDLHAVLGETLRLLIAALGLRTGWIWLHDRETDRYYSAAAQELPPYLLAPVRMTGERCWCLDELADGTLAASPDHLLACSRLRHAVRTGRQEETGGLSHHISVPLRIGTTPLGIVNVAAPDDRPLTADERGLLEMVSARLAATIERAFRAEERAHAARLEERTRLAREIHDTLAQSLTAIALDLESGLRHLTGDTDRARARLERALATTRASLEEARRSVLDLRTMPLAGTPLPEALAALGRTFTAEHGIRVRVRASGPELAALPLRVEAELYRIAQEALTNVQRHAGATEVLLTLRAQAGRIAIAIRDNGTGLTSAAGAVGDSFGLVGMRERARLLGGTLRVESQPARGTTIRASIPLTGEGGAQSTIEETNG